MMTPAQIRAARAFLGWSQPELAEYANLGLSTVRDFERGARTIRHHNMEAIEAAVTAAGLRPTKRGGIEPK